MLLPLPPISPSSWPPARPSTQSGMDRLSSPFRLSPENSSVIPSPSSGRIPSWYWKNKVVPSMITRIRPSKKQSSFIAFRAGEDRRFFFNMGMPPVYRERIQSDKVL